LCYLGGCLPFILRHAVSVDAESGPDVSVP
jgi:hypothetical protein